MWSNNLFFISFTIISDYVLIYQLLTLQQEDLNLYTAISLASGIKIIHLVSKSQQPTFIADVTWQALF